VFLAIPISGGQTPSAFVGWAGSRLAKDLLAESQIFHDALKSLELRKGHSW
jgi:hypothetical protein